MAVADALECERDMELVEAAPVVMRAAAEIAGRGGGRRTTRHVAKQALGEREQGVLVDLARGGKNEAFGAILAVDPATQRGHVDRGDAGFVAEHGLAQLLAGEGGGLEMVEDDVIGRVARLAQFGEYDVALPFELLGVEIGVADEISDQFAAELEVSGQRTCLEDGMVTRGPGVERTAFVLDCLGDLAR